LSKRGSKIGKEDPRVLAELKRQGLTMQSRIENGRLVRLLPNANLSTGGTSTDVTEHISAYYRDIAVNVTKAIGLTFAGIDMMAMDICGEGRDYCLLEINSSPGLNNFAGSSKAAEERTRSLYRELLIAMSAE
jgi:D-alanine-D-alanine ligase-like ATP-grasp enzyme